MKSSASRGLHSTGHEREERKRAYNCDITYATANEIGFDFLRDQIALYPAEQVHRPFASAVIDEADSILIDEARIPLVLAGGEAGDSALAYRVDQVTRRFRLGREYVLDQYGRNASLTDAGIHTVERAFGCANLFSEGNLRLFAAVQDSLHAHGLLRRDVDYLVKNGSIESVDEFKGRIVPDRRWPAGLHNAVEAKEAWRPRRRQDSWIDHGSESDCALSTGVRHDGHCGDAGAGVARDLWAGCGGHRDQPAGDSCGSSDRLFQTKKERSRRRWLRFCGFMKLGSQC